jgi:tetratricopeptide (TPR) repeat protein
MKGIVANAMVLIGLGAMFVLPTDAAETDNELMLQAYNMKVHGDLKGAIAILEPISRSSSSQLSKMDRGVVWNILGSCYQDLELNEKARYSYEQAARIFQNVAPTSAQYAATLDNLGAIEIPLGRLDDSEHIRKKALALYSALSDHAGCARISTNLAIIALLKRNRKAARRSIDDALQESRMAAPFDDDDLARMRSVQGRIYLDEGKSAAALSSFQEAIDRWTRVHGPGGYEVGWGLFLRARAYSSNGDFDRSISDLRQALTIFANTLGDSSTVYWATELQMAQVLRASGHPFEANSIETVAHTELERIRARECRGCSVTVEALH